MTTTIQVALQSEILKPRKCEGCRGSGKRGRGTCRACEGSGEPDFCRSPRVVFNGGYHDGFTEQSWGKPREIRQMNQYLPKWYVEGYLRGVLDCAKGLEHKTSSAAWTDFCGLDDDLNPVT